MSSAETFRMTIQAGVTDELWEWLMERGWRELRYAPDRRHYRVVPAVRVTKLIDSPPELRPLVLKRRRVTRIGSPDYR